MTRRLPWAVRFLLFYLFLITVIGKGPTYLALPPIYLSELVLAACALWLIDRFGLIKAMLPDESGLTLAVWAYIILGAILLSFCIPQGGLDAIRDAAIWYYAAFFVVGKHLGANQRLASRMWQILCAFWVIALVWCTCDQVSYLLFGRGPSQFGPLVPWRGEYLLSNSSNESIEHMALASMIVLNVSLNRGRYQRLQAWLTPLAFLALGVIAISRGRGVKVGLALSALLLLILKFAPGRPMQAASKVAIGAAIALMLSVGGFLLFSDQFFKMTQLDRFTEADPSAAEGTAYWRLLWWKNLVHEVHKNNPLFGLGFGESLNAYNPFLEGNEKDRWPVRSPHNFNMTVFSRMGYVGLALWLIVLFGGIGGLFRHVWKGHWKGIRYDTPRREELAFWIVMLVTTWGNATFGVLMEGPVLGIWFWFALGFAWARAQYVPTSGVERRRIQRPAMRLYDRGKSFAAAPSA